MNERLPDSSYDALHHFISESAWDGMAVMDRRVQAQKLQNLLHQDEALLAAIQQRTQANAPKQPRTHAP